MVAQLNNVHTILWTEFQKAFGDKYFGDAFKGVTLTTVEFQWGGGPNDQKQKLLETSIVNDGKRAKYNTQSRQNQSRKWREYPLFEKCRRRHLAGCRPHKCYL